MKVFFPRILCIVSSTLLAYLLNGCALYGPTYHQPQIKIPNEWQVKNDSLQVKGTSLPLLLWWQRFKDEELNQLIESALITNNNLHIAYGNIMSAQGQLEQIKYNWLPQINLNFGYSNRSSVVGQGYNLQIQPQYNLNILQQLRNQEAVTANLAYYIAYQDATRLAIISQVVTAYFNLKAQEFLLNKQQNLKNDTLKLYKLAKAQYVNGLISLYDLENYKQKYEQVTSTVPLYENNIIVAKNALKVLLSHMTLKIKSVTQFMDINSLGIIPANLPSEVLRNRPDVRMAEQQLIAANANIGVATSAFFPTISLTGTSGGIASQALSGLFNSANSFWVSAINATMPFLNLAAKAQIKVAQGAYYSAYYSYVQTIESAFMSVNNDLAKHQKLTENFIALKNLYTSVNQQYQLSMARYNLGYDSQLTYLNAKVNLETAAINLAQAKLNQLVTIINLYQDLGGGYSYQPTIDFFLKGRL